MFVYLNTIKDFLYSGGPRALPFSDQIHNVNNFEREEKKCIQAHFTHLELYIFFHIHSLTKPTCIIAFIHHQSVYMSNLILNNV